MRQFTDEQRRDSRAKICDERGLDWYAVETAVHLQCALTAAESELREARELLREVLPIDNIRWSAHKEKIAAFLARTKESE